MSEPEQPQSDHGPKLPVVALILSVVGLCLQPLLIISFVLGFYSWWRSRKDAAWAPRRQIALMTMVVSGVGVGMFFGVALPKLRTIPLRNKQLQCREALIRVGDAERKFFETNKRFTVKLKELEPGATRGTLVVQLDREGALWTEGVLTDEHIGSGPASGVDLSMVPKLVLSEVGLHGDCPACSLTVMCVNELGDDDSTADVWTSSSIERIGSGGTKIPGWLPWNEVDDVVK